MKLTLLAVGKLRESWVRDGCSEYEKRVRARLPLEVVEVNWQESAETAQEFWQSMGLSLPLVLDRSGDVFSQYKLRGLPDSFFVGRDGKIAAMYFGFLNEKRAREKLVAAGLP